MPRLIFFCGHAGTGKTTLAKRLLPRLIAATGEPFCLLDKDTLYGQYSSAVMGVLTGDANDRDSPLYLQHLRDPEYNGLLATARENLALGVSTLVVGPLSREVRAHRLADRAWLGVGA
ncbi:MAG: ATP-binding protein, partial [Ottowia sp.]|nr:ATP-binding protein [Ottowia sp.]